MPDVPEEVSRYMAEIARKVPPEVRAANLTKGRTNRWTDERRKAHAKKMREIHANKKKPE